MTSALAPRGRKLVNFENANSYIGSSINLSRRLTEYYNVNYLIKYTNMIINVALLKYGYSSFELVILEYCTAENVISREQYYIDLLKPALALYNILKKAGSSLGLKYSPETKAKMKVRSLKQQERLKINNSSKEHKEHLKRLNLSQKGRAKPEGSGSLSVPIEVLDLETGIKTIYPSISEAARAIGLTNASIFMAFKRQGESII
jgi:group I intron endonuclease